ncbi:hypothetical protein HF086_013521 [Spodoptera exigua]|uniref:Cationic amino acid transporter C-terminal domain-containing protein n=1 Tax=Spodoptera exigua TaxID=7107 RepID=A0A922M6Y5_SPOEX|nr:hypothetical protein HF086_013521 [Spodoptera exigua]
MASSIASLALLAIGGLKAGASRVARLAYGVLSRRKAAEEGAARLARVLSALDLTALGVGSTLGVGVYVLAGDVAKNYAGPAVILSFLLAAVASVFAGAASVVKALSEYLDSLLNKAISTHLEAAMPIDTPHLAKYPDLFAFSVIMAFSADTKNWRIPAEEVPKSEHKDFGTGGFAPYGLAGIIKGAAVCFYGFIGVICRVGFDCVATAGEEARRPQKTIPFAVVASLLVVFLAYCGVSSVLTLMVPYYMQDEKAPFPFVYDQLGWPWAKYAVSVGAICALCSRLEQLIHMMSIGTLLAYSMVASCVLLLRYEYAGGHRAPEPLQWSYRAALRQLINADGLVAPSRLSSLTVSVLVTLYGVWCFVMMSSINQYGDAILEGHVGAVAMLTVGTILVVVTLVAISRQPVSDKKLAFSVPLVPWLPGISILINVYLMLNLDYMTWLRFAVWIAAGK